MMTLAEFTRLFPEDQVFDVDSPSVFSNGNRSHLMMFVPYLMGKKVKSARTLEGGEVGVYVE